MGRNYLFASCVDRVGNYSGYGTLWLVRHAATRRSNLTGRAIEWQLQSDVAIALPRLHGAASAP